MDRGEGNYPAQTSSLNTILALFFVLRLSLLLLFNPQGLFNTHTDIRFYYETALLSEQGIYPFVNMWYEYPPLLAYHSQAIYDVTRLALPPGGLDSLTFQVFQYLYRFVLLLADCAILILVHRITALAWGVARADWSAWVYSLMLIPLFVMFYAHHSIPVVFTLLALYTLMAGRWGASALAVGLGIAAKLTPGLFLGVAARFARRRLALLGYALPALGVAALAYLPPIVLGGWAWVKASFVALANVASYSTPWSIIDGNWGTGNYGPLTTRLRLEAAQDLPGNPAALPAWLPALAFGAIFVYVFTRRFDPSPRNMLLFTTVTTGLFHLWSKGWSMQWAIGLIPLYLASFPDRRGLWLSLALTVFSYHKWPLGAYYPSHALTAVSVLARSAVVALSTGLAYRELLAGASKDVLPNRGQGFTIPPARNLSITGFWARGLRRVRRTRGQK